MATREARIRLSAKDDASPVVEKVQSRLGQLATFIKSRLVLTFADFERAAKFAFSALEDAARSAGQERALELQLQKQGVALQGFLDQLDKAAAGTISTSALIAQSSRALLLGIPADKISDLLKVATASAIATGQTATQAFKDISVGIGRLSPLILDNLGFVVDLGETTAKLAKKMGITTAEVKKQDVQIALLNQVLRQGQERIELFGGAATKTTTRIGRMAAGAKNAKDALGRLAERGLGVLEATAPVAGAAISGLAAANARLVETIVENINEIPFFEGKLDDLRDGTRRLREGLEETNESLAKQGRELSRTALGFGDMTEFVNKGKNAQERFEIATGLAVGALGDEAKAIIEDLNALARLDEATRKQILSTDAATQAFKDKQAAMRAAREEENRLADQTESITVLFGKLGVTTEEQVTKKIADATAQSQLLKAAFDDNTISGTDLRNGLAAISARMAALVQDTGVETGALAELKEELDRTKGGSDALTQAQLSLADRINDVGRSAGFTRQKLRELGNEAVLTARQLAELDPRFTFVGAEGAFVGQRTGFVNIDGSPSRF